MISRALFAALLLIASGASAQSPTTLLHDVTVIDVKTGQALAHQDIFLAAGRIQSTHPTAAVPRKANVLHTGGYVIPGLWDMHVHLAGINADPAWSADVLLPQLLKFGITSVRDMGGDLETLKRWRAQIEKGERAGPTLYFAGPMLSVEESTSVDTRTVRTADEARRAVDELQAQGADFIKILHIPRAAYFALAEEARLRHIPFVGHLPFGVTVEQAAQAGQKSIEHINWSVLALDCSTHPREAREQLIAVLQSNEKGGYERVLDEAAATFNEANCTAAAQAMAQHGTWSVPTLVSEEIAAHVTAQRPDERISSCCRRNYNRPGPPRNCGRKTLLNTSLGWSASGRTICASPPGSTPTTSPCSPVLIRSTS